MRSLHDFSRSGHAALSAVIHSSEYQSVLQAVASLAVFSDPSGPQRTQSAGLFPIVRMRAANPRGAYGTHPSGMQVMFDDNKGPTDAFLWAHNWLRSSYKDIQFNHVWDIGDDPVHYTSLANICVLPSFLSKLTDTDTHVKACLRYRAYELFDYWPSSTSNPAVPEGYPALKWSRGATMLGDLRGTVLAAMQQRPMDRTTRAVRALGWYFSDFKPVPEL